MPSARFTRFLLRTTDVDGARRFYDAVLGHRGDGIVPLHEAALARGARPHWLGHVGVADLGGAEAVASRFVDRGATRLGPSPGVGDFVVLRDPGGAVVGVTDGRGPSAAGVVWHQLNTADAGRAASDYTTLFGWSVAGGVDLGAHGRILPFAFERDGAAAGAISDVTGRPEVHAHWLCYFPVPSLDAAVERVRGLGGLVVGPLTLPGGVRVAPCDDAQGAAFGLVEPGDAARLARGEL